MTIFCFINMYKAIVNIYKYKLQLYNKQMVYRAF